MGLNLAPTPSPFYNENKVYYMQSLFVQRRVDSVQPLYSISDVDVVLDGVTYPSLRRLYIECLDPTEYLFAEKYLGGWAHFSRLSRSTFFRPYLDEWREELKLKLKALNLRSIIQEASGGKDAFNAQKFLVTEQYNKTPPKRFRTKKQRAEDSIDHTKLNAEASAREQADLQRLKG